MNKTISRKSGRSGTAHETNKLTGLSAPAEDRQQVIAVAAYLKAEARGFEPGCELEDWLAAEAELSASA